MEYGGVKKYTESCTSYSNKQFNEMQATCQLLATVLQLASCMLEQLCEKFGNQVGK